MCERENMWSYCVIDAEGELHHGVTPGRSLREVLTDIAGNFGDDCRYVYIHPLPNLMPEIRYGQWTGRAAPECCATM